jgi:hypothetical protein
VEKGIKQQTNNQQPKPKKKIEMKRRRMTRGIKRGDEQKKTTKQKNIRTARHSSWQKTQGNKRERDENQKRQA